jgi:hypothetical protein
VRSEEVRWERGASDIVHKSNFSFMRLVSEKLANFKACISAPRCASPTLLAVGVVKLGRCNKNFVL